MRAGWLRRKPFPENQQDIPGLGLTIRDAQAQLMDRYAVLRRGGLWHTLESDNYIHAHLFWHSEQADEPAKFTPFSGAGRGRT